jgi:MinD-like ATPase involved in chromosome partitioning or flagellar assembly
LADVEPDRPLPSIERALSGPGSRADTSWRRQVKVVTGGQGPGRPDQETLDRDRARLPLTGSRRIVVLGCTRGAGQTVTALMTAHILAAARGVPVAALDLNPGATSLAARRSPAIEIAALLAGREPDALAGREPDALAGREPDALAGREPDAFAAREPDARAGAGSGASGGRLDVIADPPGAYLAGAEQAGPDRALEGADYQRLVGLLAARYQLTMIDPAAIGLTRLLSFADQLLLVAPASPDAATSLANTQQWLAAHGHGELAGRAVTVVNGVSRRTMEDVLRAEAVARGRSRAIVRVPWDDLLSARPDTPAALRSQTRLAYTALAGVLIAALAAAEPRNPEPRNPEPGNPEPRSPESRSPRSPRGPVPGRNPGEHSD